jgi:hypothetical protein
LNQILRRQTSRFHYGSKVPAVTVTVFKYRNKIGKIVGHGLHQLTKAKGQMSYWRWRPLLKIAEQLEGSDGKHP